MTEAGRGCEEATWLHEATVGVEQLSLFGWQIRVESDPVMAANWLKQRRIGQGNISMRLLSSYRLVFWLQLDPDTHEEGVCKLQTPLAFPRQVLMQFSLLQHTFS